MTVYTPDKAKRLILSGKATGIMEVTGWLDLSGTQITALPDNLTVGGGLYLRRHTIMNLPTAWWRENGETARRRCIAIDPRVGYALVQTDTDRFSAGCAKNLTREQALARWNRTDARAVLFTAAINAHVLEPVT